VRMKERVDDSHKGRIFSGNLFGLGDHWIKLGRREESCQLVSTMTISVLSIVTPKIHWTIILSVRGFCLYIFM
jgi:hypothetical protein